MIKRMVYVANARLPTEKAHGYQISKMCEAFAQNNVDVLLLHPRRHQADQALRAQSVFDYYGVARVFDVRELSNLDVLMLERFLPNGIFALIFYLYSFVWGLYAALSIRGEKADLYYTRDSEVAYWLVKLGLPTVYEGHVVPRKAQRWLLGQIAGESALRFAVVLTSFIKERFVGLGFAEDKVVVLPDATDLALFEKLQSQQECRQQLGLPCDRPIVGYIGRFQTMEMEKGLSDLVQVTAGLPLIGGKEPLLLCVGGPMDAVPAYLGLAKSLGVPEHRLQFVDRVPNREVPTWIRACDVVTVPFPWTEHYAYFTSPLKLFEYMAAGVPIVASDLPSLREVLRHKGNAVLVAPGDPKALLEGILLVLKNPDLGAQLAQKALNDVRRFTWLERGRAIIESV